MYGKGKILVFLLRVSMGWIFFYAGLSKILSGGFSAAGYLTHAQTFTGLFEWLARPERLSWINIGIPWAELLIGAVLILGIFTRLASFAGIILLVSFYLPVLHFPYVGEHDYIVNEHIVYILILVLLARVRAGKQYGLGALFGRSTY